MNSGSFNFIWFSKFYPQIIYLLQREKANFAIVKSSLFFPIQNGKILKISPLLKAWKAIFIFTIMTFSQTS